MIQPELDQTLLPEPLLDSHPEYLDLYWKAWELAWQHVCETPGMPQNPYMSEGCDAGRIWIWDTCFMVHFCKYAPHLFPGIESLENFYQPIYDGVPTPCKTHHSDNPPLFAWVEHDYFRFTGDCSRLDRVVNEKRYLQRHYEFMETLERDIIPSWGLSKTKFKKMQNGYMWSGTPSGMDNTPRGRDDYDAILWLDAIAQQALSALYIAKLARITANTSDEDLYSERYEELKDCINSHYWSEEDHTYWDLFVRNQSFCKVLTPAVYWPLIAELSTQNQADKLISMTIQLDKLGGDRPWPSVAFDDPDFDPKGAYWRGGIWLPTAYMATKAMEKYGHFQKASEMAERLIRHMSDTYRTFEPATIWECYSPVEPKPATSKPGNAAFVRPDFCGWSALGPISMLIENVLGFSDVDAIARKVTWQLHQTGRHGIRRLRFGGITVSIIAENDLVTVEADDSFTLEINGKDYLCSKGITHIGGLS